MIQNLFKEDILRSALKEIVQNIAFTLKETDIYKINQSGDLANLDGLDKSSLELLPSLFALRNALYSDEFRLLISCITNSGPLSGKKTDMAVNVYSPGGHLLCHDDVIGTRRVSYILYLTDPDIPWEEHWGGALRLYPTEQTRTANGKKVQIPIPYFTTSIPPSWNQMSLFAVQPGRSFHDVEEVYSSGVASSDAKRTRIAISGWFHLPQEGEQGYSREAELAQNQKSSLTQLKAADEFDKPRPMPAPYPEYEDSIPVFYNPSVPYVEDKERSQSMTKRHVDHHPTILTTEEIDYLLQFMHPRFLVPEYVEEMRTVFGIHSILQLDNFLNDKFAKAVQTSIGDELDDMPQRINEIRKVTTIPWEIARPPHKHRYLYFDPRDRFPEEVAYPQWTYPPLAQLIRGYLQSREFRKWLSFSTGLIFKSHDIRARRFRRGQDYQLASTYQESSPRVELILGVTPGADRSEWDSENEDTTPDSIPASAAPEPPKKKKDKSAVSTKTDKSKSQEPKPTTKQHKPLKPSRVKPEASENHGGYEAWMTGDDDNASKSGETADPAVYQGPKKAGDEDEDNSNDDDNEDDDKGKGGSDDDDESKDEDDDDPMLFAMPPCWNSLSIVLRDKGTMRFVKYLSRSAPADRWDVTGEWEVDWKRTDDKDNDILSDSWASDGEGGDGAGNMEEFVGWGEEEDESADAAGKAVDAGDESNRKAKRARNASEESSGIANDDHPDPASLRRGIGQEYAGLETKGVKRQRVDHGLD